MKQNIATFILILMIFTSPFAVWFAYDEAEAGLEYTLYKKSDGFVVTDRIIYGNSVCINEIGVFISRNTETPCDMSKQGTIFVPHENISVLVRRGN